MKLHELITQYVAFEKALGKCFRSNEYQLKSLNYFLGENIDVAEVQADKVASFIAGSISSTRSRENRYRALAGFYRYAVTRKYVGFSPLPIDPPIPPAKFVPYIYTRTELNRLMKAIPFFPNRKNILERDTFRAILLLLYGAGLRLSEALRLRLKDVDLPAACILVRETKFYKTRIVPLGPALVQALAAYVKQRRSADRDQVSGILFFCTRNGCQVTNALVERCFWRLLAHARIERNDAGRYGPRLHDLRHAFAVHRLIQWYRKGDDVQRLLPRLSTYLGHISISSTQVYLTMTPELLKEAAMRFERYFQAEESHA